LASQHSCLHCGVLGADTVLPHGRLCVGCRRRRHYHPKPCPGCAHVRPLAYLAADGDEVCAGCVGQTSVFACSECGSEEHPYGFTRCARCYVDELLTEVLTDPTTGQIHARLVAVFELLTTSRRPQTTYWWLTKPGSIAQEILSGMATGRLAISHDTFREQLPMDRRHCYIRDLLTSTGVLEPYWPAIERIHPWLVDLVADHPPAHADVLNRFARWHVLRRLRQHATSGTLTSSVVNGGRSSIRAAARLLDWADRQDAVIGEINQPQLERYLAEHPGARSSTATFLVWLGTSRTNTKISLVHPPQLPPQVTMSEEARWRGVELLLHDTTINSHTRIAGLFMLLFAWPLNRILRLTHDQVQQLPDGRVTVTFDTLPIELPPVVSPLVAEHMLGHGRASYRAGDTRWLFPGRLPGRPLVTETVRGALVSHGIHPRASRSAALFSLASQIPAPVLADLVGISDPTAVQWAKLAARDWSTYVARRPNRSR
jgi:hypothetical protein